jgi:eight-cysteine-cluster-containing protein
MRRWIHLFSLMLVSACNGGNPSAHVPPGVGPDGTTSTTTSDTRTPLVPQAHRMHARLEAPHAKNECVSDGECMKGGCSGEVCAAESVNSTCEMPEGGFPVQGSSCGCIGGQCQWFSTDGHVLPLADTGTGAVTDGSVGDGAATDGAATDGAATDGAATGDTGGSAVACGGRTCAAGETCISYYGVAGARGPMFHECGIPCRPGMRNGGCPSGTKCITISDGPGAVCRR